MALVWARPVPLLRVHLGHAYAHFAINLVNRFVRRQLRRAYMDVDMLVLDADLLGALELLGSLAEGVFIGPLMPVDRAMKVVR